MMMMSLSLTQTDREWMEVQTVAHCRRRQLFYFLMGREPALTALAVRPPVQAAQCLLPTSSSQRPSSSVRPSIFSLWHSFPDSLLRLHPHQQRCCLPHRLRISLPSGIMERVLNVEKMANITWAIHSFGLGEGHT